MGTHFAQLVWTRETCSVVRPILIDDDVLWKEEKDDAAVSESASWLFLGYFLVAFWSVGEFCECCGDRKLRARVLPFLVLPEEQRRRQIDVIPRS